MPLRYKNPDSELCFTQTELTLRLATCQKKISLLKNREIFFSKGKKFTIACVILLSKVEENFETGGK